MDLDYRSIILFLTACMHLLVGVGVYTRNPHGVVHRALLLATSMLALWSLCIGATWMLPENGDLLLVGRLAHVASLFVSTGFMTLGLVFPDGRRRVSARIRNLVWALGLLIALPATLTPGLIETAELRVDRLDATYGPLQYVYWPYLLFCFGWGVGDLAVRYRRAHGLTRLQMQYLLAGLAGSVLLNVPSNVLAPVFGFSSLVWMGPPFSLILVGMVAHAIVRYRMMGIRLFVTRGAATVLAVVLAGAVFVGLIRLGEILVGPSRASLTGIAAMGVALLFQPLRNWLNAAVARYFFRPPYDYQSTVLRASRTLSASLDLDRALGFLLSLVTETLQIEHARVLMRERAAAGFRLRASHQAVAAAEANAAEAIFLDAAGALVRRLEWGGELLVREEVERWPSRENPRAISGEMAQLDAAVAVPLLSGSVLLGVLLVGPKLSGDEFTPQDIDLLSTLGAEAGAAMTNAQLHQDAMQAEKLATVGGLAAGIAHEVKNPLVAVRTFAELLPERYADAEFRESFSRVVLNEVDRIDRLIAQLLNYARPTPPRLEWVDINAIAQAPLELLAYQATRQSVTITQRLASDLPEVMADAAQLRQVILNIALNAIQVMSNGGVLRVSTRRQSPHRQLPAHAYLFAAEGMVEVEIANSGPPIPPEHTERVFEPFFSSRTGGTGLGLSICKRIVAEHHGDIRVITTEDGLTAFVVGLPIQAGRNSEERVAPRPLTTAGVSLAQR